jgi:hypothetical protein
VNCIVEPRDMPGRCRHIAPTVNITCHIKSSDDLCELLFSLQTQLLYEQLNSTQSSPTAASKNDSFRHETC